MKGHAGDVGDAAAHLVALGLRKRGHLDINDVLPLSLNKRFCYAVAVNPRTESLDSLIALSVRDVNQLAGAFRVRLGLDLNDKLHSTTEIQAQLYFARGNLFYALE